MDGADTAPEGESDATAPEPSAPAPRPAADDGRSNPAVSDSAEGVAAGSRLERASPDGATKLAASPAAGLAVWTGASGAAGGVPPAAPLSPEATPVPTGRAASNVTVLVAPPNRTRIVPPGIPGVGDFCVRATSSAPAEAPPTSVFGSAKRIDRPAGASASFRVLSPLAAGIGTPLPATTRPSGPNPNVVSPAAAPTTSSSVFVAGFGSPAL